MTIFITGTDTDVGKTVVTAGIAAVMQGLGYTMGVYKPVQSGAILEDNRFISPDLEYIKSIDNNIKTFTSYNLLPPTAPSLAAKLDDVEIDINKFKKDYIKFKSECDFVLVEGAGGIMVPIADNFLMRDLVKLLNIPLLIVARPNLGTINHTLLTISAAKSIGLDILGVIISGYPAFTDDIAILTAPKIISEVGGVRILGILPKIYGLNRNTDSHELLIDSVIKNINLQDIFRTRIPKLSIDPLY